VKLARAADAISLAAFAVAAGALLVAAAQPIFTDDLWWHLGLGEAFAAHGPWLAQDPLLFTAPGPPPTASWLADLALFSLWQRAGFTGLRVLHVLWVAAIVALAYALALRASGSRATAGAITVAFVALAAYRLVQLRPELFTILATLVLYRMLCDDDAPPSRGRIAATALLFAVWANCHAAFPLGLALLAASAAAAFAASQRRRAAGLAAAFAAGLLASLANPTGVFALMEWLHAADTPTLARVADEWARFEPWRLPVAQLPPSTLAWVLGCALLALAPMLAWQLRRRGAVLCAWMMLSLAALLAAVRFLWLGLFSLLALARVTRGRMPAAASALAALVLAAAFFRVGDWPMVSGLLPVSREGYAEPYSAAKYPAHAIWFLVDAGLEGNVFTDYTQGGFLGFFGAPRLRAFVNGSLNVRPDVLEANLPIRERRGAQPGEDFLALLDRMEIDVFVGTRLPQVGPVHRPWFFTTAHLEGAPGWRSVFRNVDSAVYVRDNTSNAANLERVAAYHAREHVPYDPERGFDPEDAIRANRLYAVSHGLVPVHFADLAAAAYEGDADERQHAADWLASLYASLGLYERALRLDREILSASPDAIPSRRRLVWSLLRQGRLDEASAEAGPLADAPPGDALSRHIAETARVAAELAPGERAARIATLPLLTRAEAARLMGGMARPEARTQRAREEAT